LPVGQHLVGRRPTAMPSQGPIWSAAGVRAGVHARVADVGLRRGGGLVTGRPEGSHGAADGNSGSEDGDETCQVAADLDRGVHIKTLTPAMGGLGSQLQPQPQPAAWPTGTIARLAGAATW